MAGNKTTKTVEGLPELKAAFARVSKIGSKAALSLAGRSGGQIIVDAANKNAPGPNIIQVEKVNTGNRVVIWVGPDRAHWYYRFFEYGAGSHVIDVGKGKTALRFPGEGEIAFTGTRPHPGITAKPFLRPALDNNVDMVVGVMGGVFWQLIIRFANGN